MTRHLQFGRKVASLHLLCKVAYVQQLQGFLGHPPFARKCQPNVGPRCSAGNSSCFEVATPSYVSVNAKVDEFWPDGSAYPLWEYRVVNAGQSMCPFQTCLTCCNLKGAHFLTVQSLKKDRSQSVTRAFYASVHLIKRKHYQIQSLSSFPRSPLSESTELSKNEYRAEFFERVRKRNCTYELLSLAFVD
jgi:hypothetical protein